MTIEQFIKSKVDRLECVHDLSLGALFAYHQLQNKQHEVYEDIVVIRGAKSDTFFLYGKNRFVEELIERPATIISASPTNFPNTKKQKEIMYDLNKIFHHTGNKKYHSLSKPLQILNRSDLGITIKDIDTDLNAAEQGDLRLLHDKWVKYKLSLPNVHRISFPTARYRRTLDSFPIPMYRKAIYIKGQLYGFIVFSLQNKVAFELSFVTLYFEEQFKILNGLNQYLFSYFLIDLYTNHNIKFCNSGFVLNKNLGVFKKNSQESIEIVKFIAKI